jgi:hypothetical protein
VTDCTGVVCRQDAPAYMHTAVGMHARTYTLVLTCCLHALTYSYTAVDMHARNVSNTRGWEMVKVASYISQHSALSLSLDMHMYIYTHTQFVDLRR